MLPDRLAKILMVLVIFVRLPVAGQMFEWVSTYKTEGLNSGVSAIATDNLGNVYVSAVFIGSVQIGGQTLTTAGTDQDTYLAKYDANGNFLWVRHISGPQHQSIYSIAITSDNQIVATGSFQYQLSIDGYTLRESPYYFDFADTFLLKFSANGTVVMAKNVGFAEDNLADQGFGVAVDLMDNIYVAGGKGTRMFFLKTNAAGDILWKKTYGFTNRVGSISAGPITVDRNGNVFVSGTSLGTGYLHKIDTNGNFQWTQSFTGFIGDLQTTEYGEVIICGSLNAATSLGRVAFPEAVGVIGKMNSDGVFTWQRSMIGFRPARLSISRSDKHIYFTSSIVKDVAFGPIVKNVQQSSDLLVGAISSGGSFSWVSKVGEKNGEFGDHVDTDPSGNIFIANKIAKDSVAIFQCEEKIGQSKEDVYIAKISPFMIVPVRGPAELCPGQAASYSYTPLSQYGTYSWNIDSQEFETMQVDATDVQVRPLTYGALEIGIETSVDLGCEMFTVFHSIQITVHALVEKISVVGNDVVCAGAKNVRFSISSAIADSENNKWTYPDAEVTVLGNSPTELTVNFAQGFQEGQIYYIREGKCNSVVSDPLSVKGIPSPGPTEQIIGETVVCAGTAGIFTVAAVPHAQKYLWTINYGWTTKTEETSANLISIAFPEKISSAKITVAAYNQCGFTSSPAFDVEVKHKPEKPAMIELPADICGGDEVVLLTPPIESSTGFHWLISNSQGQVVADHISAEPQLSFNFSHSVIASVSSVNMCGESPPFVANLQETKDPQFVPHIERKCDILFHEHDHVLRWFKDGVELSSEKMIEVHEPGEYVLTFIGKCSTFQSTIMVEEQDISEFVPNILTPNGDGQNDYFEISAFLRGSQLNVFNRWGGEVFETFNYDNNWNGNGLPSGVYLYTLKSQCTGKVLKGTVTILR